MQTYTTEITFGYKLRPDLYVLSNKIPEVQYRPISKNLALPIGQGQYVQKTPTSITVVTASAMSLKSFCFHPETFIELQNSNIIQFKSIKIGDILSDGSIVEKVIVHENNLNEMYEFPSGIKITGNHEVLYNEKFILVKDHPDAVNTYENINLVYDIITNTHRIPIGNYIFYDGTELVQN